jgi:hypothetical protein
MSDILKVVFGKGVLFDINVSRWSALHQMKTNDLLLEKLNRKIIYPGHKKLLPEDHAYPLVHIEGKIRTFVRKNSMDFPISGAVFVNFKALPKMLAGLKKLKEEFETEAKKLHEQFPVIKTKQIEMLDNEALKIAVQNGLYETSTPQTDRDILKKWLKEQHAQHLDLYPKQEDLLAKYSVSWTMFKINPLDSGEASFLPEADAETIVTHQKKLQDDMEKWVKDKATEMHKLLGEAAAQAQQLLAENGKLNPKNLKPLFSAFEQFKAVDFAGSSFEKAITDIEKQYIKMSASGDTDFKSVAESVNSNTDQFSALLQSVSALALDEVAQQAGAVALANSEFKRVVEV